MVKKSYTFLELVGTGVFVRVADKTLPDFSCDGSILALSDYFLRDLLLNLDNCRVPVRISPDGKMEVLSEPTADCKHAYVLKRTSLKED